MFYRENRHFCKRKDLETEQLWFIFQGLFIFLYRLELFTAAPNRACGCAAKFGARGFRHCTPHRTSFLPNRQGQPQKKNRFRGSFLWQACTKKIFFLISCTDSNFSLLMYIIAYFAKKHKRFSIFALTFFLSNYNP